MKDNKINYTGVDTTSKEEVDWEATYRKIDAIVADNTSFGLPSISSDAGKLIMEIFKALSTPSPIDTTSEVKRELDWDQLEKCADQFASGAYSVMSNPYEWWKEKMAYIRRHIPSAPISVPATIDWEAKAEEFLLTQEMASSEQVKMVREFAQAMAHLSPHVGEEKVEDVKLSEEIAELLSTKLDEKQAGFEAVFIVSHLIKNYTLIRKTTKQ